MLLLHEAAAALLAEEVRQCQAGGEQLGSAAAEGCRKGLAGAQNWRIGFMSTGVSEAVRGSALRRSAAGRTAAGGHGKAVSGQGAVGE